MPKRKLTPFLCQELLYDYAIDSLDAERKSAVEEFLKGDAESRKVLETIHKGFWYADQLSKFEVTSALVSRLEESENIVSISKKVSSYNDYPDWLKWSLVTLLASGCIAIIVVMIPWAKLAPRNPLDDKTLVLAPLNNEKSTEVAEQTDEEEAEHESSGDFDESGAPVEDDAPAMPPPPTATIAAKPAPIATIPPLEKPSKIAVTAPLFTATPTPPPLVPKATPTPKPVAVAKPILKPTAAPVEVADTENSDTVVAESEVPTTTPEVNSEELAPQSRSESRAKGFVYRGFMTIPNIEDVSAQIVQQIKELGGQKAGEVELGWKRGSLRYFHFTIPEANQEKLMELLRAYGPVRISKDPHPRVMPEGQVRFILSIDAK